MIDEGQAPEEGLIRSRHAAREVALQAVYSAAAGGLSIQEALEACLAEWTLHETSEQFASRLASAALKRSGEWDALIEPKLHRNWGLDRLAIIDHVCLWCGLAELFTEPGIPPKVTITVWVRMAKKYGGRDSHSFVHGVLGALLPSTPKANWTPDMEGDYEPDEEVISAQDVDPEEIMVAFDDPVLVEAKRMGAWQIKVEEEEEPGSAEIDDLEEESAEDSMGDSEQESDHVNEMEQEELEPAWDPEVSESADEPLDEAAEKSEKD